MKNHKLLSALAVAASAVLLSSCQTEGADTLPVVEYTINAEIGSSADTKTQISEPDAAGQITSIWTPGDVIGVYGKKSITVNSGFSTNVGKPSSVASFSGYASEGDAPAYAYYPYVSTDAGFDAVPVSIPSFQAFKNIASVGAADIKYGTASSQSGSTVNFSFSSAATLLRITVDATGLGNKGVGDIEGISSLKMSVKGKKLTGEYKMNLTNGALTFVSADNSDLFLTFENGKKVSDGQFVAYAVIAPGVAAGDEVSFQLTTLAHTITATTTAKVDFEKGKYYELPLTFSEMDGIKVNSTAASASLPTINEIKFLASLNKPAILDKEVYNVSGNNTQVRNSEGVSIAKGSDGNFETIIPYLNNRNLKPSFTLSSTPQNIVVLANGSEVRSGQTVVDFTEPVIFTVMNTQTGETREQTVTLKNTGLPVVVADIPGSGSAFLGVPLPGKTADFAEDHHIKIYNADGSVDMEGDCGIRQRGNYSGGFPKKAMGFKLVTKTSVLGMPKHKRWVLLANWFDKTLIRNAFSFQIADAISKNAQSLSSEESGMGWQPHGQFVELVLNGRYVGNYFLCEQIKIDKNRVKTLDEYEDVRDDYAAKPDTKPAPAYDTVGYLFELDDNNSVANDGNYYIPLSTQGGLHKQKDGNWIDVFWSKNDYDDTPAGQKVWADITKWVQDLDQDIINKRFANVRSKIDYVSAADYMLTYELTMSHDYRDPKSVYAHKSGAGKLFFGPVWDFDVWSFPNDAKINSYSPLQQRWTYSVDKFMWQSEPSFFWWFKYLLRDQEFVNTVKSRWSQMQAALPTTADIDALANTVRLSASYDAKMWPQSLSVATPNWNMKNGDEDMTYDQAIASMKSFYTRRIAAITKLVNSLTTDTYPNR